MMAGLTSLQPGFHVAKFGNGRGVRVSESLRVLAFLALLEVAPSLATATAADARPEPPPVVTYITAERFYTNPGNSIADLPAEARNKASLLALNGFVAAVVKLSDEAVAGDAASGRMRGGRARCLGRRRCNPRAHVVENPSTRDPQRGSPGRI